MTRPDGTVLLTGATGFVGMELLARYLERTERPVVTIVRAGCDDAARERIDAVLENLFGDRRGRYADRVTTFAGDLTAPRLGLDGPRWEWLASQARMIMHGAASVSFDQTLEDARAINVEGTRRMLELAGRARELGVLERYAQISTAYVAGTHAGRFFECDHDVGQSFHNSYEQSKFEAERLVRSRPRTAVHDPAPEHRGRRPVQRLDGRLQRPLLAAAGARARSVPGGPGARIRAGRRRLDRLRRGRDPRAVRVRRRDRADLSPHGRRRREHDRRDRRARERLLPPARAAAADAREFELLDHDGTGRSMFDEGSVAYFPYFASRPRSTTRWRARDSSRRGHRRAATRVPGSPTRLRDDEPLGQARRSRGPRRWRRSPARSALPPTWGVGAHARLPATVAGEQP